MDTRCGDLDPPGALELLQPEFGARDDAATEDEDSLTGAVAARDEHIDGGRVAAGVEVEELIVVKGHPVGTVLERLAVVDRHLFS